VWGHFIIVDAFISGTSAVSTTTEVHILSFTANIQHFKLTFRGHNGPFRRLSVGRRCISSSSALCFIQIFSHMPRASQDDNPSNPGSPLELGDKVSRRWIISPLLAMLISYAFYLVRSKCMHHNQDWLLAISTADQNSHDIYTTADAHTALTQLKTETLITWSVKVWECYFCRWEICGEICFLPTTTLLSPTVVSCPIVGPRPYTHTRDVVDARNFHPYCACNHSAVSTNTSLVPRF
jgi:hypothetical protein